MRGAEEQTIMQGIAVPEAPGRLYPRLILLAIGLFIVGTNAFVIAGLLPAIAASLGVRASDVSYSITFYSLIVAVAAPIVAIVVPRWSRTSLMATGLVLIAIGTVIAAFAHTLELFTIGRVVAALGGAALVPTATAAAAAIAPPARRGQAIAFVALGFAGATALGAPLGTALGALGGWQVPLDVIAALAVILALAMALTLREVPLAPPVSLARRFAPLRDHRVLMALGTTLCVIAGFNIVYIFSSAVTSSATGGDGTRLALLLLLYGVGGLVGNLVAGQLADRLDIRLNASLFLGIQALALFALPLLPGNYLGTAVLFALWGIASFASLVPIQHRLVSIDPALSALALSWYTTAMYIGIALAPPLGATALRLGGPQLLPLFGAAAVVLSGAIFQIGYVARARR